GLPPPVVPPPQNIGEPNPSNGIFDFVSAVNKNAVWVVTNYGGGNKIYLISVDAQANYPTKEWWIPNTPSHGNRTYVSEIGLILGKEGGKLYRIDPDHPSTHSFSPFWTIPGAKSDTRSCTTSFKVGDTSYVGVAWESTNGHRQFTRIPIDLTKPEKMDLDQKQTVDLGATSVQGNARWSYSCFIDQSRNHFWSGWASNSSFFGVNVATMTALDHSIHPPNKGHTNSSFGTKFLDPALGKDGSYALAGDAFGDILTGSGMYTFVHETRNKLIYGSESSADSLIVAKEECFSTVNDCTGKFVSVNLENVGRIGPLSSLNDGRIIGIVRGNNSQVYVVSPTNPEDLTQPITATRIKEVTGNAYMYNDFTGGSLFPKEIDLLVDLSKLSGWVDAKKVKSLSFTWTAQAGGFSTWKGLTLKARCYKAGETPPDFAEVTDIKDAGQTTLINVESCMNKVVDKLELQLRPMTGASDFTRTSQIKIFGLQE
ncbi:MAG: hypothetical protein KDD43_02185, partial [Bdellovibrionales bacterium]|nr:hypothetical protein [Bdellovibrionales bacterium]